MIKIRFKTNYKESMFKIFFLGVARPPLGPRATCGGPMGPLINYREERANARDEREVFISGRHYRRQDDADGIITRPKSYSWVEIFRQPYMQGHITTYNDIATYNDI